jgi:hypothetical protein
MITITKVGSLVKIDGIEGKDNVYESISNFQGARISDDGAQLKLQIGEVSIDYKPFANFTIGGVVPTSAATVQSALATVFPNAAPGTALPTETVATYAAMTASIALDSTTKRDFFVSADETNGGGKSSYRYDGANLIRVGGEAKLVPLFVIIGESNASGRGLNTSATSDELAIQQNVKILNNTTLQFENMQIGVNNNLGELSGVADPLSYHGIELELANKARTGSAFHSSIIYVVKAGQGGSKITDWNDGGKYWNAAKQRMTAALTLLKSQGMIPVVYVFYSQGLNDAGASTDVTAWKTKTISHFTKIRSILGYVPIVMTRFMTSTNWDTYNKAIYEICKSDGFSFPIYTRDATLDGTTNIHWSYAGLKTVADRFIDICTKQIGELQTYFTAQATAINRKANPTSLWEETAITFTAFTESPTGTWNAAAAANDVAVGNLKIPNGVNGYFRAELASVACTGFLIALDSATGAEAYGGLNYAFYANSGTSYWTALTNNTFSQNLAYYDPGDLFQLRTDNVGGNLTVYAEISRDGGFTWITLKTFTATTSRDLYLKANAIQAASLVNPKGLNVV